MSYRHVLLILLSCLCAEASARAEYKIATDSENSTYIEIGKDLMKYVAAPAGIDLQVVPSKGSVENVKRLRDERGTRFALVQSDVYQAFKDQAAAGNAEAARLIEPLRVILPLYDEEIHFIVRADSPLEFVHEIENRKINIGLLGSGAAMTAVTLYRLMFDHPINAGYFTTYSNEEALLKLARDKSMDVVVVVSGQPTRLLLGMEPGVEKYFKLLKFDPAPYAYPSASARALRAYSQTSLWAASYPNWLTEDIPALSVKTFLVTYDYKPERIKQEMSNFVRSLCANLPLLQQKGHLKWRQVSLELPPLGKGWSYYGPTEQELARCAALKTKPVSVCTQQEMVMGLCKGNSAP